MAKLIRFCSQSVEFLITNISSAWKCHFWEYLFRVLTRRPCFPVHREFRDATRVFARFKNHGDWEEFLNDHLSK